MAGATGSLADLVRAESRPRGFGRLLGRIVDLPLIGPILARLARLPGQPPAQFSNALSRSSSSPSPKSP